MCLPHSFLFGFGYGKSWPYVAAPSTKPVFGFALSALGVAITETMYFKGPRSKETQSEWNRRWDLKSFFGSAIYVIPFQNSILFWLFCFESCGQITIPFISVPTPPQNSFGHHFRRAHCNPRRLTTEPTQPHR